MDRRPMTRSGVRKDNRRLRTFLWIAGFAILMIALLYFEQTAVLYLLATLGLTALLFVVAQSDLSGAKRITTATDLGDDSAALGSGISGAAVSPQVNPARRATAAKRKPR